MKTRASFFAITLLMLLPCFVHAQASQQLEVEKFSARGFSKLLLVKVHLPHNEAATLFESRGAKIVTAKDRKELESLSEAAFTRKILAPVDLRVLQGTMMAGAVPYKWPTRKSELEAHQLQFGGMNFQDKVDSGYVRIGEKHKVGYVYRSYPDKVLYQFYVVQTDEPERLRTGAK
jgi:hypothetical protein